MNAEEVAAAARRLLALHEGKESAPDLGPRGPGSVADGHAVQDALVRALGQPVGGWKVARAATGELMRGAILAPRLLANDAVIDPRQAPLLGIEVEVAFRLREDLPAGGAAYDRETFARSVDALPAIEVVASRFEDYHKAPLLHRLADIMSNGFLVVGAPQPAWRTLDLVDLGVTLSFDGAVVKSVTGGHAAGDPLIPALALANSGQVPLAAGTVITTGTYVGVNYARPGTRIVAEIDGFEPLRLTVAA